MRDISTITVSEARGLWEIVMPERYKPFRGRAYKYKATEKLPKRITLENGVERLGIYFNGHVWADSDLTPLKLDRHKISEYLKSIGINLK